MNKNNLFDFLNSYGKLFVQVFCPLFGVLAQECYQILKIKNYKIKNILPKLVLAWFVCLILGAFITESTFLNKFYPYIILLIAAGYRIAADFLFKDFLPTIFQIVLKYLNSKNPKKDE